jgi:protein-S-isoprenylcysteine O-methyltransferase Ste14
MTDDDPFRLTLLAICLVFMPIGAYHRFRAHTGERIDRWQEGVVILFGLRLTAALMFVAGFAWMINPTWLAWSRLPLPLWLRWIGIVINITGACLWVWTVHTLGKNLTDTVVTRQQHTLVTHGPYRWVRHPFYTSCLICILGVSFAMANWFVMLTGAIVWFAFLLPRTRMEEMNLLARFGDDYHGYMQRTGRFWPRFKQ